MSKFISIYNPEDGSTVSIRADDIKEVHNPGYQKGRPSPITLHLYDGRRISVLPDATSSLYSILSIPM